LTTANNDICIFSEIGISSTYLESGDFACILNISVAAVIKEKLHKVAFNQTFFIIYLISNPQLMVI